MNLKKLEKATKIYEQIKIIDAHIIQIEKLAMLAASGEIKSSFQLKIEDIGEKNKEAEKVKFDEHGSLIKTNPESLREKMLQQMNWMPFFTGFENKNEQNKHQHLLEQELSENLTLQILGILLYEKNTLKKSYLSQLEKLGVLI